MTTPEEFFSDCSKITKKDGITTDEGPFGSMQLWPVKHWSLAMRFADAYANRRELEIRKELSEVIL